MAKTSEMLTVIIVLSIFLNTTDGYFVSRYPGHFHIGALFSMRRPPDSDDRLQRCGKIEEVDGIQKLEAALLALTMINKNMNILPGVTLGIEVADTCWSGSIALLQSLFLIGDGTIPGTSDNIGKVNRHQGGNMDQMNSSFNKPSVIGLIGPPSSEQTTQVQNLFNLFNIPQIGFFYNTPHPNDAITSSTVLQMLPCKTCQSKVVRDILKEFNWSYVATVYTTGYFGEAIIKSFRNLVNPECSDSGICIGKDLDIKLYANETEADAIIREIDEDKFINVVICFCERQGLRYLFEATKRLNLTNRFTFITSDGWGSEGLVVDGLEKQAWGTISVQFDAPEIPSFSKYYTSLKPSNNTHNPWFAEFWEHKFNCKLPKIRSEVNSYSENEKSEIFTSGELCKGNESLADGYFEHRNLGYVMKIIWAMAHGLHNMITEICGVDYKTVCDKIYPVDTKMLLNHLSNLSFYYEGELVTINDKNYVPSYIIVNYQKKSNNNFDFIQIGDWTNGTLKLTKQWQSRGNESVTSVCSSPCESGSYMKFTRTNRNQACCWECQPCGDYQYVSWDKKQCIECPKGEIPNFNRTACDKIPLLRRDWSEPTTIMIVTFSVIGLILTLFTLYIFMKYKDTPVVKASSREICYVILFSMILSHASVFINLVEPTSVMCALSGTLPGISLTIMFSALFTKTHRIARILAQSKKKFPKRKRRLMSTSSQVAITFICVAIEIALFCATLPASPLDPITFYPSRDRAIRTCYISTVDAVPTLFNVFLHGLCIIYAIKTRNVPGNFNEAKFMGFAMLFSLITWIFFFTLYFGTPSKVATLCICLTLNASFTLIFLFFPKLYIIILRPEKNNRALFITNKNIRTHVGPNIKESSCEYPINLQSDESSAISMTKNSLRSRRNVAVQTSSKLLQKLSSSSDKDGNQLFCEAVDDYTLPKSEKDSCNS